MQDSLMDMARFGATEKGGVKRLTLTDIDRQGRDYFRANCEAAGLTVRVDAIGNMFARRPGRDPKRLPVLFGSHLDSQPTGGKFDGALGVIAGLEVMRSLNDLGITTEAPVELINWTDEEGSRFGHSLMGSGVWAGIYTQDKAYALADLDGVTVGQALRDMAGRLEISEVKTFVAAVTQADQLGTSIAGVLRAQSGMARQGRMQRVREQAARLPVTLLFPLVVFIFPAVFVVLLGPSLLRLYEALARMN